MWMRSYPKSNDPHQTTKGVAGHPSTLHRRLLPSVPDTPSPQAYAPTGFHDNRCLLIFGCTSDQCGIKPGSWRAWRCQLEPHLATADAASATAAPATSSNTDSNAAAASTTAAIQQQQQPTDDESMPGFDFEAAADDWGLGADGSADGAFRSSSFSVADGALDFSDLASAVEQAAADLSAAKRKAASAKAAAGAGAAAAIAAAAGGGTGGGAAGVASCMGVAGPWLPGFHIYAEEEPAGGFRPMQTAAHAPPSSPLPRGMPVTCNISEG